MLSRPSRRDCRFAAVLLITAGVVCTHGAMAGLTTKAPKDVSLAGAWKINSRLSDDPQKIVEEARRQSREPMGSTGRVSGSISGVRGSVGGIGDIFGGGVGVGARRGPSVDPAQRESMRAQLETLKDAPEDFEIEQAEQVLTWKKPDDDPETCKTGEKKKVYLPGGDLAERRCGWDGKAFVVEVTLLNGFTRTDRYELGNDGKQLTTTTELKGTDGRRFKVKRVYVQILRPGAWVGWPSG